VTDLSIPIIIAICNRGGAKTWLTAVGVTCLIDNITKLKANVLSGSFKQGQTCYKYARDIFTTTDIADKVISTTMSLTRLIGGGEMSVLTASEKQTRAPRVDILVIDEACLVTRVLLESILPQIITAKNIKVVILTTPNILNSPVKKWWDEADKYGIVRHQWGAHQCNYIDKKNIAFFRNILDENSFRIEILGLWGSAAGTVFKYSDIQRSLIGMEDLPPLDEMDLFSLGIDWGDAHPTVAVVSGMRGDVAEGTDEWYVYYVQEWKATQMEIILFGGWKDISGKVRSKEEYKELIEDEEKMEALGLSLDSFTYQWGLTDIINFYRPIIYSEQSPVSAHANRKLRQTLSGSGVTFRTDSFSKKKFSMVSNLRSTLEKGKYKIPRVFRVLIGQLFSYAYKIVNEEVREDFKKINDDYVDALNWSRWVIHPATSKLTEIGELGDLDI
jgi:hypothetical protein